MYNYCLRLLFAVLAFVAVAWVYAQTNPQTTATAAADERVRDGVPNGNWNTDLLRFRTSNTGQDTYVSYIRFDLTATQLTNITRARLRLTLDSAASFPVDLVLHAAGDAWNETGITWNNRPVPSGVVGQTRFTGVGGRDIDVTNYVVEQFRGDGAVTFALVGNQTNAWVRSSEHSSGQGPVLLLEGAGSGGADPAPTSCTPRSGEPYCRSEILSGVEFLWDTHDRRAQRSDNWATTWALNDAQFTSWGDGCGFEDIGNCASPPKKKSQGVSRIDGGRLTGSYIDVWEGDPFMSGGPDDGKSYGIIDINGILYQWVSPGSGTAGFAEARLWRSTNNGVSWTKANWAFTDADGLIFPTFLQFGAGYANSRDNFVYIFTAGFQGCGATLCVQVPGEIFLIRVNRNQLMTRSAYEFFAGFNGDQPTWSTNINARRPVVKDTRGVSWNTGSATFNPAIGDDGRYFFITEHASALTGNIGIFDAPEPWGPWTVVHYSNTFPVPGDPDNTFYWLFSNKWTSEGPDDGFVMIFSGAGGDLNNDSWNSVLGRFLLTAPNPAPPPPPPPEGTDLAIAKLVAYRVDTDEAIYDPFTGGPDQPLNLDPGFAICAEVSGNDPVGSVQFVLDGQVAGTENIFPYCQNDEGGDFRQFQKITAAGSYILDSVTPYTGAKATGMAGGALENIELVVVPTQSMRMPKPPVLLSVDP